MSPWQQSISVFFTKVLPKTLCQKRLSFKIYSTDLQQQELEAGPRITAFPHQITVHLSRSCRFAKIFPSQFCILLFLWHILQQLLIGCRLCQSIFSVSCHIFVFQSVVLPLQSTHLWDTTGAEAQKLKMWPHWWSKSLFLSHRVGGGGGVSGTGAGEGHSELHAALIDACFRCTSEEPTPTTDRLCSNYIFPQTSRSNYLPRKDSLTPLRSRGEQNPAEVHFITPISALRVNETIKTARRALRFYLNVSFINLELFLI